MFRPAAVNSFGREYKPGRPVNKETRRRIIDLYLVGEEPSAISRSVRVTKGAVWKSFDIMRRMILVPAPVIGERFIRARAGVIFVPPSCL